MTSGQNHIKGIIYMLGASFCFALMACAAKLAAGHLSAAEIIFVRSLATSLLLAVWICQKKISWTGRTPITLAARGVIGFIAMYLYFWCLPKIDLGTAMMLNYTAPIFAVLVSVAFFKERCSHLVKAAILGSFAGVYLLVSPQWHLGITPLLAGLLSGCLAGMVHVLIRQMDKDESPFTIIFYFTAVSTVGSAAILFSSSGWEPPSLLEWGLLLVITLTSFAGQLFMTHALRSAPVSVVSPFGYITPVLGLGLGYLFWRQVPATGSLVGGAIVILCGLIMYRRYTDTSCG